MAGGVVAIAVRGRWLKHTYPDSPALPERDPPPDNRWQRGDIVDALYLADSEDTVWAEWYRHLAERAIPPLAQMLGSEHYRVLYRRSERLIVLLHAFPKTTGKLPASEIKIAQKRWNDFKARMDARPRNPPRAAGSDAP